MFSFTRSLRKEREKHERRGQVGYSFGRLFKQWQAEHSVLCLIGIWIDVLNGKGPVLTSLLGGISFCRLFLKLVEANDPQVWTVPNAITAARIAGVAAAGFWILHARKEEAGAGVPDEGASLTGAFPLGDAAACAMGAGFVALDLLDGFLARRLGQTTALGAQLDGAGDGLGTAFLALVLLARGRIPAPLACHLAAAPHLYPLLEAAAAAREGRGAAKAGGGGGAKHPWARPAAGAMAVLAVAAVAVPALSLSAAAPAAAGGGGGHALAWICGTGAGTLNLVSFGLSYATLAGVPLPGNGVGKKRREE